MQIIEISNVAEYVSYIESIENRTSLWFRGVATEEHKPIPGLLWRNVQHRESSLEHGFLVSYKSYLQSESLNPWEIFALMQHHGLPTRLLDWSESALVALYFALTSEPDRIGDRTVWVMNP
ncbi:FRG domain-containing protein, partial [Vibrio parahaemolyticus]